MGDNKKRQRSKYPIKPYLAILLIAVMGLVILSYFIQRRNQEQEITHFNQIQTQAQQEQQGII